MINALLSLRCSIFCILVLVLTDSKAEAQISGTNLVGPGSAAQSSASYGGSFGSGSNTDNYGAFAIGTECGAEGAYSMCFGAYNGTNGTASVCLGWGNTANGMYSLAFGAGTVSTGTAALATGNGSIASGAESLAANAYTTATGNSSATFGLETQANSYLEFVIGQYNVGYGVTSYNKTAWVASDPLFEIGNGTSSTALSDAVVAYKNGSMKVQGPLTVSNPGGDIPMYAGN